MGHATHLDTQTRVGTPLADVRAHGPHVREHEAVTDEAVDRICMACGRTTRDRTCPDDGVPTLAGVSSEAGAPAPGAQIGGYRVEGVLGHGGMGVVLAATTSEGEAVALKLLHPERARDVRQLQRFHREAVATARIDSQRVVRTYGLGVDPATERPYLVMERVDAPTLAEALDLEGSWDVVRALRFVDEVAEGLEAAAEAGVVHRDLKPSNLFVTPTGARIADFGVALVEDEATLTSTDSAVGTTGYMAPEQIGGGLVDGRADIYALACVLYAILRGHPPFRGERLQVLLRHLDEVPPPLLAPRYAGRRPWSDLEGLVAEMLAKTPADRPGPGTLRKRLAQLELPAAPADLFTRDEATDVTLDLPRPRRSRAPMLAGLLLVAALAAGLAMQSQPDEPPARAPRPRSMVLPAQDAAPPPPTVIDAGPITEPDGRAPRRRTRGKPAMRARERDAAPPPILPWE